MKTRRMNIDHLVMTFCPNPCWIKLNIRGVKQLFLIKKLLKFVCGLYEKKMTDLCVYKFFYTEFCSMLFFKFSNNFFLINIYYFLK
jgi:hypothetical protein